MKEDKSSADLWREHEAGDSRALGELVDRVSDRLIGEIDRRLHSPRWARLRHRCTAEDVLDDVFARAMAPSKLAAFFANKNATFLAWLIGFIDGELRNRASRRHLSREVSLDARTDSADGESDSSPHVAEPLSKDVCAAEVGMKKELVSRLCRLVESLPESQRSVVTLRHFCGLTFEEIAETTNKSTPQAAWQAYSRAVAALRRGLEGDAES